MREAETWSSQAERAKEHIRKFMDNPGSAGNVSRGTVFSFPEKKINAVTIQLHDSSSGKY